MRGAPKAHSESAPCSLLSLTIDQVIHGGIKGEVMADTLNEILMYVSRTTLSWFLISSVA
jgi:hypothetical protein